MDRDDEAGLKAIIKKGENEKLQQRLMQEFPGSVIPPQSIAMMQVVTYLSFMLGDDLDSAELFFQNKLEESLMELRDRMNKARLQGMI